MSLAIRVASEVSRVRRRRVLIKVYGADEETKRVFRELVRETGGRLSVSFEPLKPELEVSRGPVIVIGDNEEVRWTGRPTGLKEDLFARALSIVLEDEHEVPEEVASKLRSLRRCVRIEVFVTSMCPDSLMVAEVAVRLAVASRGKVKADIVMTDVYPELARRLGITEVPAVVLSTERSYSGKVVSVGVPKLSELIRRILELGGASP